MKKHSVEKNIGMLLALAPLYLYGCNEPPKALAHEHKAPYMEQGDLTPSETLKIVRVPDPLAPNLAALDKRCVIYLNRDLGTSNMVCLDGPATDEPEPHR